MLILLLGLLAPAHGRAGGGHGPFRREGVGDGCSASSRSSAPVSRLTANRSPHKSPSQGDGGCGGSAVGRPAHRLPHHGRRSPAGDVTACLAQRLQRRSPQGHEPRRLCGRRDTKRSDWRDGRAVANTSRAARPRAWRALGVAIWPGQRAAQLIRTGLFAKQAVRAQREGKCLRSASAGGPQWSWYAARGWKFGPTPAA
jgi:hypothetical protein